MAELRDELHNVDVWYHLTHGLGYDRDVKINPSRYGDATWWDRATARHAEWTDAQRQAVIAALELRAASDSIDAEEVRAALDCYWRVTPPPIGRPVIDRP